MVKFDEIIHASLEWTTTVLFRPFAVKKWFILTFIALLAGTIAGGSNFRLNLPGNGTYEHQSVKKDAKIKYEGKTAELAKPKSFSDLKKEFNLFLAQISSPPAIYFVISGIALILIILIIFTWLYSRFSFIFLQAVSTNDASIKLPFGQNRETGNSLFSFNIILSLINTAILILFIFYFIKSALNIIGMSTLKNIPAATTIMKVLSSAIPYILLLLLFILLAGIIQFIINNFVVPVMFKEKKSIFKALPIALEIINNNKANTLIYLLISIGFYICASIIYSIISFIAVMAIIFPVIIIGSLLTIIYKTIPVVSQPLVLTICVIIGIPVMLFFWYCLICMYLPFAVFFRAFSLKFLGKLDSRYDLFKYS
ncbi:MAG: hypothetical protein WC412_05640 [Candidatus Omnitrophota bacterium]|jgi:hypothetical protein